VEELERLSQAQSESGVRLNSDEQDDHSSDV